MHRKTIVRHFVLSLLGASAFALAGAASGQSAWQPGRNVEIVVAQAPGGGIDRTARTIQRVLQERRLVTVPVLVVNKPGGGGVIAQNAVLQAPADGHHVHLTATPILTNEITGAASQGYRDFSHLAYLYDEFVAFAVRPGERHTRVQRQS